MHAAHVSACDPDAVFEYSGHIYQEWRDEQWYDYYMRVYSIRNGSITDSTYVDIRNGGRDTVYTCSFGFYDDTSIYTWEKIYRNPSSDNASLRETRYLNRDCKVDSIYIEAQGSGNWKKSSRDYFTYTTDKRLKGQLQQTFLIGDIWDDSYRWTYTTYADGKITEVFEEDWLPVSKVWQYTKKNTYAFNASLLVENVEYNWSYLNKDWHYSNRYTFEYDENNQEIEKIWSFWKNDTWQLYYKYITTYDSERISTRDELLYDSLNTTWNSRMRYIYAYSDTNTLQTITTQFYNEDSTWKNLRRRVYLYGNSNGIKIHPLKKGFVERSGKTVQYDLLGRINFRCMPGRVNVSNTRKKVLMFENSKTLHP